MSQNRTWACTEKFWRSAPITLQISSGVITFDFPQGPYLLCLLFAFRRIGYRERQRGGGGGGEERSRWTPLGELIRAVQSPVCPKPFVVMCHTPARQTAS